MAVVRHAGRCLYLLQGCATSCVPRIYSSVTVTDFARLRGWSTLKPLRVGAKWGNKVRQAWRGRSVEVMQPLACRRVR